MKILLAPDSFKGSLDSFEVCRIMAHAIAGLDSSIEVVAFPLADGGEGSSAVLQQHCGGRFVPHRVSDPLGRPIEAGYLALESGQAVVEVASASGLGLMAEQERDPMRAGSRGTGELIAHALRAGHRELIVTLGGSATNDAGAGLLSALGYRFLDAAGEPIPGGGAGLQYLDRIDMAHHMPELDAVRFLIASDVNNPLVGERGATAVFGPQKGATPEQIPVLDAALERFGHLAGQATGKAVLSAPGAGAAGGIGAALMAFTDCQFRPGFSVIAEMTGFVDCLAEGDFDLVITGEGQLDVQTLGGKLPQAVARLAAQHGVPVIAVAGRVLATTEQVAAMGIQAAWPLGTADDDLPTLIGEAPDRLEAATRRAVADFLQQQG